MNFSEVTRFTTVPQISPQLHVLHTMALSPPDDGVMMSALRLPAVDLLTGAAPVVLRPLAGGMSRVYAMRHNEMRTEHTKNQLMHMAANMMGAALVALVCRHAAPLLGTHVFAVNASLNVMLILGYLYHALRQRVELQALGAARLLSEAYEEMSKSARADCMAERYSVCGHQALNHARVLGMTDPRLAPAAEQYAQAYNAKFGNLADILLT